MALVLLAAGCVRLPVAEAPPAEPPGPVGPSAAPSAPAAAPGFAKAAPAPEPAASPFAGWVLPVDHGIRADKAGQGQFLAPRFHGKHNGVDLLAPMGTPVLAACSGTATAGVMGGYGKWVKLVCKLPEAWADGYLSLFYSHLSAQGVGAEPSEVTLGQELGAVGKSGNAAGPSVMPHLHLELIVQPTKARALAETHSGRDRSNTPAADELLQSLRARCLEPLGLESKQELRRERRLDPYLVLGCLGAAKPAYQAARGELRGAGLPWHMYYTGAAADPGQTPFKLKPESLPQGIESSAADWLRREVSRGLAARGSGSAP